MSNQQNQQFKADGGKPRPDLLQIGMARALRMVQATMEYGASKYEAHSWRNVDNGIERYLAAAERHRQERHLLNLGYTTKEQILEAMDEESGLPHIAHEVFCLLAIMELAFYNQTDTLGEICEFNEPPQDHKNTTQPLAAHDYGADQ